MITLGEKGVMTDFHSHIIPRLDHGSGSVETSLWQINAAKKAGISRIVATSHFYANAIDVPGFYALREKCFGELRRALPSDAPEIILGAEVLVFENLDRMPYVEKLCIAGTNVFLAELPMNSVDDSIADTIHHLIRRGLDVVLAHADRYDTDIIDACVDVGAKIQLNADGLLGDYVSLHRYAAKKGWERRNYDNGGTPVKYGTKEDYYYYLDELEDIILTGRNLYDGKALG